jgi:hypothetical protein
MARDQIRQGIDYSVRWAFGFSAVGFALTFFGSIVFALDANQGPFLRVFMSGPLGFACWLVWGLIIGRRRLVDGPAL